MKMQLIALLTFFSFTGYAQDWSVIAKQDLTFIKDTLIENHPGYHNAQDPAFKEQLHTAYAQSLARCPEIATREAYATLIEDYAKSFDDVHLAARISDVTKKTTPQNTRNKQFTTQEMTDTSVWVTVPTFEPNENQQKQLEQIIQEAASWKNKTAIIFDVRGNGGGNSVWGKKIINALFSAEYAAAKITAQNQRVYVDWRCSQANIEYMRQYIESFEKQFGKESEAYIWAFETCKNMQLAKEKGLPYYSTPQNTQAQPSLLPNPVQAHLIVIIDRFCASACLDFIDYLKAMDCELVLIGEPTKGDSVYMEVHVVDLPSGQGKLCFPMKVYRNRVRGNKQPYIPDIYHDVSDTAALKTYVTSKLI